MDKDITKKYPNIAKIGNITTPYLGQTKDEKVHEGIDIANHNGTPINANVNGKVIGTSNSENDFGKSVIIKDTKGNVHRYSHLKDLFAKMGDKIKKGIHLANMGDSGNSYSPSGGDASHLDYRVYNKKNKSVNPTKFFK
jgi:murein DD-endopeptidase MepM/ murein hydrolase activator NlpD